jgi:arylsulfatase A-like enzyme
VDPYPFSFLISRTTLGRVLKVKLGDYNIRMAAEPTAGMIVDRFLAWQDEQQGAPFFALLNVMDAHEPYMPPPPYDRKFSGETMDLRLWRREARRLKSTRETFSDAYDEGIAYLDSQVQRLVATLAQRGRLQNTLIVILSDHGEAILREGVFDHGHHVYREQLHIPLVMHLPGKVPAGLRVATPVSGADVPATIAQLTGLAASQSFPGESLTRFWNPSAEHAENENAMAISELTLESGKPWFTTALTRHWQYILNDSNGEEMLFDLRTDPEVTRNLAKVPQYTTTLAEFRSRLEEFYRGFPQWQPSTVLRGKQIKPEK